MQRNITAADICILSLDKALTTIWGQPASSGRADPAEGHTEAIMTEAERRHNAALMRVNHAGEVSAQALYQGQALTAKSSAVKTSMQQAAIEENDHLLWCQHRLQHLSGHRSVLNPVWYAGAFALGAIAGKVGDKWSLGFVAETEQQVEVHINTHLQQLVAVDKASEAVLLQMRADEIQHGQHALNAGAHTLPMPVKKVMTFMSKLMTSSSFWV